MSAWLQFRDWPLRAKVVALLAAASLLPLGIATWINVHNASAEKYETARQLLQARAQMLGRRIDALNEGYARIANLLSRSAPAVFEQARGDSAEAVRIRTLVHSQLKFWTDIDPDIRGVALLDKSGAVMIGTEPALEGIDLSRHGFVRDALGGKAVVSDVFLSGPEGGDIPTIGYLAPVRAASGSIEGAAAIWVNASALTRMLSEVNDETGPGSFAILVDSLGIRIAHPTQPATVFHPLQSLAPQDVEMLVTERRFGEHTRELVSDALNVHWEPRGDFRDLTAAGMFRATGADGTSLWAVGQHCTTVPWIVFHQVPTSVISEAIADMVRSKLLFAALIMILALATGILFAAAILRPIRRLETGALAFGAGNLDTRVAIDARDELGRLGTTFNQMAGRIQQQAATLQRESADQHRKLFETMTEAFCTIEMIFDDKGYPVDFVYLEANQEFERQSGLHNVVGRRKTEIVRDLPEHWMQIYGRISQGGDPVDIEEEDPKDGRHYHVRAYHVGGQDSRRVAVLFNDITERRLAEQRKQAQLESLSLLHRITRAIGERQDLPSIFQVVLHSIEEHLPVDFACICRYDTAQIRLDVDCFGPGSASTARDIQLHVDERIPVEGNALARCVRGQLLYEPDIRHASIPLLQRLAAAGFTSLVAAPLQVESRVFGVLITARRINGFSSADCEFLRQLSEHVALAAHHAQLYTALQLAYDELRETQQAAMQKERLRALGQMASGIAHDINNAISPVALYTDSLLEREGGLSEQGRAQMQVIQRAIHDVSATVARMREFYREREPQLILEPVQLNELVPQVVDLTRARWSTMPQQRGITIEQRTSLQPDLPTIMGAESEIREALTNLVFNAVDAMPDGGVLTLRTATSEPGKVIVEVRDTGTGMDEDARRRCLEPFFTTKGKRGTGLGLAMVYGVAQRHSAHVEIESEPGKGTCVRLLFDAALTAREEVHAAPVATLGRLRILVIDDDPVLLRTLCEILQIEGQEVVTASGGQEGIDAFQAALDANRPFSVVFTDLGMPQIDGRQVARAIKARSAQMPVIMLTGWGERMITEGDLPADVDMVLSKPPTLRRLREALAGLVASGAIR